MASGSKGLKDDTQLLEPTLSKGGKRRPYTSAEHHKRIANYIKDNLDPGSDELATFDLTPIAESSEQKHSTVQPWQKAQAVAAWCISGNVKATADALGYHTQTIRKWMSKDWWPVMELQIRRRLNSELDGVYTRLINHSLNEVEDRILNGDEKVDPKSGKAVRQKVSARDLMVVAAVLHDKRQLLRGEPTSHTKTTKEQDEFKELKQILMDIGQRERDLKQVEGQIIEQESENG